MIKINQTPLQDGYSASLGSGIAGVQTEGGGARLRRSVLGSVDEVTVSWDLGLEDYDRLIFIFENQLARGFIPFKIDLIIDCGVLTEYTATVAPDSLRFNGQVGLTYNISATLLVKRVANLSLMAFLPFAGGLSDTVISDLVRSATTELER